MVIAGDFNFDISSELCKLENYLISDYTLVPPRTDLRKIDFIMIMDTQKVINETCIKETMAHILQIPDAVGEELRRSGKHLSAITNHNPVSAKIELKYSRSAN